ncbi:hypothetical protein NE237_014692 [Protea cynaroides]|uniref:Uncharacterized protein n=1 Tax=Protea cynaroides TaxID=273540 RepID=A0A9Q0KCI6_9MAGN|nr:hypothetical protein NE237_014692 [Protea cynaroides]
MAPRKPLGELFCLCHCLGLQLLRELKYPIRRTSSQCCRPQHRCLLVPTFSIMIDAESCSRLDASKDNGVLNVDEEGDEGSLQTKLQLEIYVVVPKFMHGDPYDPEDATRPLMVWLKIMEWIKGLRRLCQLLSQLSSCCKL